MNAFPAMVRMTWVAATAGIAASAAAQSRTELMYRVVDLSLPPASTVMGVSDSGRAAGNYFGIGGQRRGFVWSGGALSDIGTLGGIAQALAVNSAGTAVGYSVDAQGRQRAVRFAGGVLTDLGTLHNGVNAAATGINTAGWVIGMSEMRIGNAWYQRAALWRDGAVLDLGTFGGEYSEANAINDAGQVVGWAWTPFPARQQRAFLWTDSAGLRDLGALGSTGAIAQDINEFGAVVGSSTLVAPWNPVHAFLWTPQTGMIDLGTPPGAYDSSAVAVNNSGQIVGNSFLPQECRTEGFVWQNGTMRWLNELVEPASGWVIINGHDINDFGVIAATARQGTGTYRAVLLVPIRPAPLPSATSAR
jgi:probable HAF family extracellular repeat protein